MFETLLNAPVIVLAALWVVARALVEVVEGTVALGVRHFLHRQTKRDMEQAGRSMAAEMMIELSKAKNIIPGNEA